MTVMVSAFGNSRNRGYCVLAESMVMPRLSTFWISRLLLKSLTKKYNMKLFKEKYGPIYNCIIYVNAIELIVLFMDKVSLQIYTEGVSFYLFILPNKARKLTMMIFRVPDLYYFFLLLIVFHIYSCN